jgi:hypothetical protein
MKITQEPEPSLLKKIAGFVFFLLITLYALVILVWELLDVYQQVSSNLNIITLHKGSLYHFGCFILSGILTFGIFHDLISKRSITERHSKWANRGFGFGIICLLFFPVLFRLSLEEHLEKKDYIICEMESVQWSIYRKIVYTSSLEVCDEAIEVEKNRIEQLISSPLF